MANQHSAAHAFWHADVMEQVESGMACEAIIEEWHGVLERDAIAKSRFVIARETSVEFSQVTLPTKTTRSAPNTRAHPTQIYPTTPQSIERGTQNAKKSHPI